MKACTACGETKPFDMFTKDRGRYIALCRPCRSAKRKAEYAAAPEKYRAAVARSRAANPDYAKTYRAENRELCNARTREWRARNPDQDRAYREANPEREKERARRYALANPEKVAKRMAKRRATKRNAFPEWADTARIAEIYEFAQEARAAGVDCEVDHIVPLAGRKVCGLHVHQNLRVVLTKHNRAKGNKFEDSNG